MTKGIKKMKVKIAFVQLLPGRNLSESIFVKQFPESARILMLKGAELLLVPNACPMELNRLSQLRGRAYENMLAIATCNYPSPYPDCNGHSTLFDGVIYLPELSGSRDTCANSLLLG